MKLQNIDPASSADYLVTAEGLPDVYFTEFSGVNVQLERAKFVDGYSAQQRTARTGSKKIQDITLATPFDPETGDAIIAWLQSLEDGRTVNLTVRPVMRNSEVVFRGSKAWKLSMCRLLEAKYPKADLNAPTDPSKIEAVFSCDLYSYN